MARSGVTRFVIGKVLNHAESGVTAVYDRSSYEPEIQRALALWGQRLMGILRSDASDNVIRIG